MTNEYLLPDELGWKCNDEISDYIDKWRDESTKPDNFNWDISKAELMDNVYAIIKKYQRGEE